MINRNPSQSAIVGQTQRASPRGKLGAIALIGLIVVLAGAISYVVILGHTPHGSASQAATPATIDGYPNVQGDWTGTLSFTSSTPVPPTTITIHFVEHDGTLSGTLTAAGATQPQTIVNGTIDKQGHINFPTLPQAGYEAQFSGAPQSSGHLAGTWTNTGGNSGTWDVMRSG
jgi:hypothetical protein